MRTNFDFFAVFILVDDRVITNKDIFSF